jgi:RNA polymerase sigma-70 factor (ECF subfamily)
MSSPASSRFPVLPLAEMKLHSDHIEADATDPGPEITDEALMYRLREGDKEALAILFRRHALLVRNIGRKLLGNDAEADDLVQDLFVFLYSKRGVYDSSKSTAVSWIVQMTYRRAISRRRYLSTRHFYKHKDLESYAAQRACSETPDYEYSAVSILGRTELTKIVADLTDDQRETLRLHFVEGYTLKEISAKTGQPIGNVRHHYYRGLEKFRKATTSDRAPRR